MSNSRSRKVERTISTMWRKHVYKTISAAALALAVVTGGSVAMAGTAQAASVNNCLGFTFVNGHFVLTSSSGCTSSSTGTSGSTSGGTSGTSTNGTVTNNCPLGGCYASATGTAGTSH